MTTKKIYKEEYSPEHEVPITEIFNGDDEFSFSIGTHAQINQERLISEGIAYSILKDEGIIKMKVSDFTNKLHKIFRMVENFLEDPNGPDPDPNPNGHRGPRKINKDFELDEFEINLSVESGANLVFSAKGKAAISLKYKRKKVDL
jgi:hypothetical protein